MTASSKLPKKRLSLVEMEMRLKQFDLIKDASIIILEENSRRFPAATLVLNEQGSRILQEEGRMKMRQELRKELLQYFEAIVLPKKWRYAEQIPEDSQGKRNHQELKKLFDHE